jgi:hypothetical protein
MTIDIFSIAPRLKSVAVDNFPTNFLRVDLPFPQLRSYVSKAIADESEDPTLDTLSNLEYLGIGSWECALGPLEPPITFARLKILMIIFSHDSSTFFEHVILPSISEIHVWSLHGAALSLSSTISRSLPCNLHTLSIGATTLENPGDLTSLLLLTPQLVDLRIPLPPPLDISNLFATTQSPVLLPKLRRLSIAVPAIFPPSFPPSLAILITMRCEMPYTGVLFPKEFSILKFIKLEFPTGYGCRLGYIAIQPSPPTGDLDDDVLALMNSWKERLVEEIPLLSGSPTPRKMFINLMHWRRLDRLFNTIEGYNIPQSGYLHVRHVPSVLMILSTDLWKQGLKITFCDVHS